MKYNESKEKFDEYINQCRQIILKQVYYKKDLEGIKLNPKLGLAGTVQEHRLKMVKIKVDHTMRMIEQVIKTNQTLNLKFDFQLVMKLATLYHDIGRFKQSTWSNSFSDTSYKNQNKPYLNHGEEGEDIFKNNNFAVDEQYIPLIGEAIKYHVTIEDTPHLQYKYNTDLSNIDIRKIITGKQILNEAECQVASLITQLIADMDKIDILYQYLSENSNFIREYVEDDSKDTLDNIATKWGISKSEIIDYNNLDETKDIEDTIRIPIKNLELSKLEVPEYMKEMFYNNTWIDLKILQKDPSWNFICALWWRLSHFLNNINFQPVLVAVEELKLIENIEKTIPDKLKPLVEKAFEYTQEVIVAKTIKENQGNIYIKRSR